MVFTIALPDSYPLVLLTAVGGYWLNFWQAMVVSSYRKAGKVKYPLAYADSKEADADKAKLAFNCAQRAHQNTLENAHNVIAGLLITGLKHPKLAVAFGVCGILGRVMYTLGYATGDPTKRSRGAAHYLATYGLLLSSTYTVVQFVLESPGFLSPYLK